ncbi:MAG TPA: superoxide dismutase [Pseudonocardiaceae bacterium]|nr:superoxide dismutase [Pseudonocardiaceae bacterium]
MRQRVTLAIVTAAVAATPVACGYQGLSLPAQTAITLRGQGALTEPGPDSNAVTFNSALAPSGARLAVTMIPSGLSTTAELTVNGLQPNRGYAVNAHTNACNNPDSVGLHYQNRVDPAATLQQPSTNPEYVNPQNEIWLDVRTDAGGSGTSRVTVPFVFTDRGPGSIVVHEAEQTPTGPGEAGKSGAPVACLTLAAVRPQEDTLLP